MKAERQGDVAPEFLKGKARVTDPGALERARVLLRQLRVNEAEALSLAQDLEHKNKVISSMRHDQLPLAFTQAGVEVLGLAAEGNYEAVEAKLKPYYKASIAADWPQERQDAALDFLVRDGAGDLIKRVVTVELPRESIELQDRVLAALQKLKVPDEWVKVRRTVPWGSLTAWVKEQIGKLKRTDLPLDVLGASVGQVVEVKSAEKKERKTHGV